MAGKGPGRHLGRGRWRHWARWDIHGGAIAVAVTTISETSVAIRASVPLRMLADVVHPFPTVAQGHEVALRELAAQLDRA